MEVSCIDYREANTLPKLIQDYLYSPDSIREFFEYSPSWAGFDEAIENRNLAEENRSVLANVLKQQYQGISNAETQLDSIELLRRSNTFTVTTGHQLCLFTGPSYFVYKILSVVKLARQLKERHPDKNFVPVYWMATEDHDFEEINHFFFKEHRISWDAEKGGAVGRLNGDLTSLLGQVNDLLGLGKKASYLKDLFETAYSKSTLAEATRSLVHELLGAYGVVILDADDASLKSLFAPIMELELTENRAIKAIQKTSDQLEAAGYKAQVNARDINLFYLTDSDRERIVNDEKGFATVSGKNTWTRNEILHELSENPERFSPNVVMRPIYQESILPNISYSGGAGEMSYWFQLKSAFDSFKVPFPILCLRNSALLISQRDQSRIEKLGMEIKQLFQEVANVEEFLLDRFGKDNTSLDETRKEFETLFQEIKKQSVEINPDLEKSTEATQSKALKLIDKLEKKLIRGEKVKHKVHLDQYHMVLDAAFPAGTFQERRMNFSEAYLKFGAKYFDVLLDAFEPIAPDITVLVETSSD